ncbi:MAG: hypothetical protein OQK82_00085 [Candidatus Pacearchaeota archaeon]|nr:hypothetical protein [Candidatus Pacearchaeota archaeon]
MKQKLIKIITIILILNLMTILASSSNQTTKEELELTKPQINEESLTPEKTQLDKKETKEEIMLIPIEEITQKESINIPKNKTQKEESTKTQKKNITLQDQIKEKNQTLRNSTEKTNSSVQYINLDNITSGATKSKTKKETLQEDNQTQKNELTENQSEKIQIQLYKNKELVIKGEIPKEFKGEIKKQEKTLQETENEFKKEVTIKSKEHLKNPLTIYTDIPKTNLKENIKIYWKNEDKEIKINDYIDKDKDGFYERIAWIVPHLSEQIFEIEITLQGNTSTSEKLKLDISAPPAIASNPIKFKISTNYSNIENLECNLSITKDEQEIRNINFNTDSKEESLNLQNGNYTWKIICANDVQSTQESGEFTINEDSNITNLENIYLLGEDISFNLPSDYTTTSIIVTNLDSSSTSSYSTSQSTIPSSKFSTYGNYQIKIEATANNKPKLIETKNISIIELNINLDKNTYDAYTSVPIYINILSSKENIEYYELKFGDSSTESYEHFGTSYQNTVQKTVNHNYTSQKDFILTLTSFIGGKEFVKTKTITIELTKDTNGPEIDLIYPKDNAILSKTAIVFKYEVEDESKISNCTYELYNYSGYYGSLEYKKTTKNIDNGEEIKISLYDFDQGDYTWYVTCYDNNSNKKEENRDFTISFNKEDDSSTNLLLSYTHDKTEEIKEATTSLEAFLTKVDTLGLNEQETLKDLEILDNLKYYQKRLIQIDQDLGNNLKFITDANLRQQREKETLKELEEIIQKIPTDIKIIQSEEYIKTSLSDNFEETLKEYLEKTQTSTKSLKKLIEQNKKEQDKIIVSTKIKKLEITYNNKKEEITLTTKEIKLEDTSKNLLLEFLPKELTKDNTLIFLTPAKEISKNIFEINRDDLTENKLIYYINSSIDINNLKESQTILFTQELGQNIGITGYVTFDTFESQNPLTYLIIFLSLIFLIYIGILSAKKIEINLWKKEANVERTLEYLKKTRDSLRNEELETAKNYYHKTKEIYPLLPKGFKKHIQEEIKKIRVGIDKRDISKLVMEYEKAKQEKRKNDSDKIYQQIKTTYKRLPKKYQEKIYNRMFKPKSESIF